MMANTSRLPGNTGNTGNTGSTGSTGHGAQDLKNKAQDVASNLGQRAQDAASSAAQTARETASNLGQRAEDSLSNVGERMSDLAGTLRDRAPREGMLGNAASSVASGLETGGRYLQEHGFSDMSDDLSSLIRSNPIPSLLIGFGAGFLVGMALRR